VRGIRRSLWVAIAVDLAIAPLALLPVRPVADALGIPIGEPVMYLRFAGLLFLVLPIFYFVGARDDRLSAPVAGAASFTRLAGVLFLVGHLVRGAPSAFWIFVAVEAIVGALHVAALRGAGMTPWRALSSRP